MQELTQDRVVLSNHEKFDVAAVRTDVRDAYIAIVFAKDRDDPVPVRASTVMYFIEHVKNGDVIDTRKPDQWIARELMAMSVEELDELKRAISKATDDAETDRGNGLPDTSRVLHMSPDHLCPATKNAIAENPAYYHAMLACPDEDGVLTGYILEVPDSLGAMPEDLKACLLFADRMDARFVLFEPHAPFYRDIYSRINIGHLPSDSVVG